MNDEIKYLFDKKKGTENIDKGDRAVVVVMTCESGRLTKLLSGIL